MKIYLFLAKFSLLMLAISTHPAQSYVEQKKSKDILYGSKKLLQVSMVMINYLRYLKNLLLNKNDRLQCDAANFLALAV